MRGGQLREVNSDCRELTGKILVFMGGVCLREVVVQDHSTIAR